MKRFFISSCIALMAISANAQTNITLLSAKEISSIIRINNLQKNAIHDALARKKRQSEMIDSSLSVREKVFRQYAIDKECHEEIVSQLSDKQIADYCNTFYAPEIQAKTDYRVSLLSEVDGDYTEAELAAARKQIYDYLMLEKIVFFKYKYDYARQRENISRMKAVQPTTLKASINNEYQKGYDKVVSGKVHWGKGHSNKGNGNSNKGSKK